MSTNTGLYEQIKTDLGYLQLDRAAEVFATLAEDARTQRWTHIEFLARLLDEQSTHTRDRRLAARLRYAKFPFHKTIADFDFEFQPSIDPKLVADLATLRFIEENRPDPVPGPARLRQDPPRGRFGHRRRRSRLARLLHHRRRHVCGNSAPRMSGTHSSAPHTLGTREATRCSLRT